MKRLIDPLFRIFGAQPDRGRQIFTDGILFYIPGNPTAAYMDSMGNAQLVPNSMPMGAVVDNPGVSTGATNPPNVVDGGVSFPSIPAQPSPDGQDVPLTHSVGDLFNQGCNYCPPVSQVVGPDDTTKIDPTMGQTAVGLQTQAAQ